MSGDPYHILGLEPTADQRAIKQAYAALLKRHRPDVDPEGFRRIRDAFERLIRRSASSQAPPGEGASAPPPSLPPAPQASPGPPSAGDQSGLPGGSAGAHPDPAALVARSDHSVPERWAVLVADLAACVSLPPGTSREQGVVIAVRELSAVIRASPAGVTTWSREIARLLAQEPALLAAAIEDRDLICEQGAGLDRITALVLRQLRLIRDWPRIIRFASTWNAAFDDTMLRHPPGFALTRTLATWLAMVDYPLAKRLAAHCLRRPGTVHEAAAEQELDLALTAGAASIGFHPEQRALLADLFLGLPVAGVRPSVLRLLWKRLAKLPPAHPLRRMVATRAAGLFPAQIGRAVTTSDGFGYVIGILMLPLWVFGLVALLTRTVLWELPWWVVTGAFTLESLLVLALGVWLYRRLFSWFYDRFMPTLTAHAGPFDWVFWTTSAWVLGGLHGAWLSYWNPAASWSFPLWLGTPLLLAPALSRLRRRLAQPFPGPWRLLCPPWQGQAKALGDIAERYSRDVLLPLRTGWRVVPAMVLSAILVGGLATSPGLAWDDREQGTIRWLFWSGPALLSVCACHAWLRQWWQHRPRRWLALAYWTSWCAIWPSLAWGLGSWRAWPHREGSLLGAALIAVVLAMSAAFAILISGRVLARPAQRP